MVNLYQMFNELYQGVMDGNTRYTVMDSQHIMDTVLNVKYHLYPEYMGRPYELSVGDKAILSGMEMTKDEAQVLTHLAEHLRKHYASEHRQMLYDLYTGQPKQQTGVNRGVATPNGNM